MTDEERPEWKYICRGCQTNEDGEPVRKVRDGLNSEETAETLARIHRVLNNGHDPEVMQHG